MWRSVNLVSRVFSVQDNVPASNIASFASQFPLPPMGPPLGTATDDENEEESVGEEKKSLAGDIPRRADRRRRHH
jgi:hypothetical protein